jgi:hypothetical protein
MWEQEKSTFVNGCVFLFRKIYTCVKINEVEAICPLKD